MIILIKKTQNRSYFLERADFLFGKAMFLHNPIGNFTYESRKIQIDVKNWILAGFWENPYKQKPNLQMFLL